MYIVSTSSKTIVSDFQNLETESIYVHPNGEESDFQFFSKNGVFVEINLKGGLEIMRIKQKDNKMQLQKVRKLAVEALTSVACAKQSSDEIAVGMANGCVSLYNINSAKNLHRFKADTNRTAVSYLDYNLSDEYLASVYESGLINIYGMTTKNKLESINIDGNSLLARFHPTKRFLLGIASNKGTVTVYDTQCKRKIFNVISKHAAPCRDLCFSMQQPQTLVSVGYDCHANVFDTRRRIEVAQYRERHPLSTVAMSDCGTYICLGNLKGELSTLDMRNLRKALAVAKVHDTPIRRLSFVPNCNDLQKSTATRQSMAINASQTGIDNMTVEQPNISFSAPTLGTNKIKRNDGTSTPTSRPAAVRDSLFEFLDNLKTSDRPSLPVGGALDTFDWDSLGMGSGDKRSSIFQPLSNQNSIAERRSSNGPASVLDASDMKQNKTDTEEVITINSTNHLSVLSNLSVDFQMDKNPKESIQSAVAKNENDDKENVPARITDDFPLPQMSENNSTPVSRTSNSNQIFGSNPKTANNTNKRVTIITNENVNPNANSHPIKESEEANSNEPVKMNANEANNPQSSMNSNCSDDMKIYMAEQINNLRLEMTDKVNELKSSFKTLLGEINFAAEDNKWEIISQNAHLSIQHMNALERLERNVQFLMQCDPFVKEFHRLKAENEQLKNLINNTSSK